MSLLKSILLILCCTAVLHAADPADTAATAAILPANQVSTDASLLLLGAWNAGYTRIFAGRLGLYAHAAAGAMAFTDITAWYQFQFRYYLVNRSSKGIFTFLTARHTGLKYDGTAARATSFGCGIGFAWISWKRLFLEANLALSFSPDKKVTFSEYDGYANRHVNVGGLATPWATGVGFVF